MHLTNSEPHETNTFLWHLSFPRYSVIDGKLGTFHTQLVFNASIDGEPVGIFRMTFEVMR